MSSRSSQRRAIALATVALSLIAASPSPAAQPRRAGLRTIAMRTIPPVSGMKLAVSTGTYETDAKGVAHLKLRMRAGMPRRNARAYRTLPDGGVFKAPRILPRRLPNGGIAKLERFYGGGRIALATFYSFRPRFVGPDGRPVDSRLIQGYRLKSRTGQILEVKGSGAVVLQATRVVPYTGELVSKDIEWSLERVMVDGTNVVNRAQNRFSPRKLGDRAYTVSLLFYPARVTSTDAIFGFHLGKEVRLTYPSGLQRRIRFGPSGKIVLPALPRGTYLVKVNAPGLSPERPVAVSRPQVVELRVISWLDIALAGLLLGCLAVGLLVARRPHLRRLPPRLRVPPAPSEPSEPSSGTPATQSAVGGRPQPQTDVVQQTR